MAKSRGARRLVAVDEQAAALGLAPGLGLADARVRVPALDVVEQDGHADHEWLERLADGCGRYTPTVALDPPDGLLLDIGGAAHLFGGEAALADDLDRRLARLGVSADMAFADAPDAARALARYRVGPAADEAAAIRRLPVAALGLEADATVALARAGLKTVGDVARRPASAIAARFGAEAATALRRLLGEAESPLAPRRVAPPLTCERRFAEPIARTEDALAVTADLLGEAFGALEARHAGGRRFEIALFRSDGLVRRLGVETGLPTRDAAAVMRLVRERLDGLADPVDPGFGFDLVRLAVPIVEPLAASQLRLEGGAAGAAQVADLVDRLSTRLGRGRVRRFARRDTHIPEQAELMLPAADAAPPADWQAPEPGEPPLRPIHLFDPPQPIEVIAEVPDGPPHRFRWRRRLHDVARAEGPERIATEWWRRRTVTPGGGGLTRDYFRVEDRRGRRFWIFRHGLVGTEAESPRWYIHGLFA